MSVKSRFVNCIESESVAQNACWHRQDDVIMQFVKSIPNSWNVCSIIWIWIYVKSWTIKLNILTKKLFRFHGGNIMWYTLVVYYLSFKLISYLERCLLLDIMFRIYYYYYNNLNMWPLLKINILNNNLDMCLLLDIMSK